MASKFQKSPIEHLPLSAFKMIMAYAQALDNLTRCNHYDTEQVLIELKVVQERRNALISKFTHDYPGFDEKAFYNYMQGVCTDQKLLTKDLQP